MKNKDINIKSDFLTFKNQIIQKFGEQYFEQAVIFLERAEYQAKQGLLYSAIADGRFALELSNYNTEKRDLLKILFFLSEIHYKYSFINESWAYYEIGLTLLDSESAYYKEDRESYKFLMELIEYKNSEQIEHSKSISNLDLARIFADKKIKKILKENKKIKDNEINIQEDFLTFKSEIIQRFGELYSKQTEIFFKRATAQAEQGLFNSAIADGKFALEMNNYSNDTTGIHYLLGFLSQLHCDLGQISKSRAYYNLGLKLLDPESSEYEEDKKIYINLKELIDGESWKGTIEDN